MTATDDRIITNVGECKEFFKKMPIKTQFRFPSTTASSRTYGVTVIVYDSENDAILLIPYFIPQSYQQRRKAKLQDENPEVTTVLVLLRETGLEPQKIEDIGKVTDDNVFTKHIMLVTEFSGHLLTRSNSEKNGIPFWIKRELISTIFEEKVETEKGIRTHAQIEAYAIFNQWWRNEFML